VLPVDAFDVLTECERAVEHRRVRHLRIDRAEQVADLGRELLANLFRVSKRIDVHGGEHDADS
jgi:hypothetical protein